MSYEKLVTIIRGSFFEALIVLTLITIAFMAFEPTTSRAITDSFTVSQTVSGAISFLASTSDVVMVGTLDGLTGGTSNGTTTVRVRTNNSAGYNMTIKFASTTAILRNADDTKSEIQNFQYSTGTVAYPSGFNTSGIANAQFGFSIDASTTADISDVFTGSGGVCGTGDNTGPNNCWRGASTTDVNAETELISTSAPTPASGSTSTVLFQITIPNNPNPAVPDGTYVATATLTATDN